MKAFLLPIGVLAAACCAIQVTAQVSVTGVVYRMDSSSGYERLPNVRVAAFRQGPTGAKAVTDPHGRFELKVPEGPPFKVVFYDDDRLPEMQQLAGKQGLQNTVAVALLTPEEHQRIMGANVPIIEKLACLLRELPKEGPEAEEVRGIILRLQAKLKQPR